MKAQNREPARPGYPLSTQPKGLSARILSDYERGEKKPVEYIERNPRRSPRLWFGGTKAGLNLKP